MFKLHKTKRFLFNSEDRYGVKELAINWIVIITLLSFILFFIMFAIASASLNVKTLESLSFTKLPEPANTFSTISFVSLFIMLISLCFKIIFSRKRRKHEKSI